MLLPLLMNLGMFGESGPDLWFVDARQVRIMVPEARQEYDMNAPQAREVRPE